MKWMQEQRRYENLTYLALWGMLFAVPVLSLYIRTVNDANYAFNWDELFMIWRQFAIFLLIFLIHNFFLAPLLVYKHKRALYLCSVAVITGLFIVFQCSHRPQGGNRPAPMNYPSMEASQNPPFGDDFGRPPHEGEMEKGPRSLHGELGNKPMPPHGERFGGPEDRMGPKPPAFMGEHDIVALIILLLMLGMNLGVKYYFKSRHDAKQLMVLEKENLEQQLEYLKYQINPHFFMNTLNNIHALVDIDPEQAKDTILELSKMMRFVLYEGDKKGVPLSREFEFIRHYVTLMRMRYTDKVEVKVDLPTETPDYELPPLMLITFIENAFKHGISYQRDSFIHVKAAVKGSSLYFECHNSKADKPNEERGGVGLTNVKQRLNLIYGENYTLNIQDEPDTYNVELVIPLA